MPAIPPPRIATSTGEPTVKLRSHPAVGRRHPGTDRKGDRCEEDRDPDHLESDRKEDDPADDGGDQGTNGDEERHATLLRVGVTLLTVGRARIPQCVSHRFGSSTGTTATSSRPSSCCPRATASWSRSRSCSRSSRRRARLDALRLGYTEVRGSDELRAAVAGLYDRIEPTDVVTLAAAEEGIFALETALLGPGDHAVVETPCYESGLSVARATGADVDLWRRSYADGWLHDLVELERLLRDDTRLVYIATPHNPTGISMPRSVLDRIVELCAEHGTVLLCDEVYRELPGEVYDAAGHVRFGLGRVGAADAFARLGTYVSTL